MFRKRSTSASGRGLRPRPRSRRGRIAIVALLAAVLVWVVGGYFVIVHPRLDNPEHADAIVVLGSVHHNGRLNIGFDLATAGVADNLLLSVGASDVEAMNRYACNRVIPHVQITCFTPDPATTRGEAELLHRLAAEHGWRKVIVVTSTYHVSRARYIFDRCLNGSIEMVAAGRGIGVRTWAYEYVYQTLGYLKAFTESGC